MNKSGELPEKIRVECRVDATLRCHPTKIWVDFTGHPSNHFSWCRLYGRQTLRTILNSFTWHKKPEHHSSTDMYLLDKNKQTSFLMMMHASIDTMAPNC